MKYSEKAMEAIKEYQTTFNLDFDAASICAEYFCEYSIDAVTQEEVDKLLNTYKTNL
jgi:hypothetical protein